MPIKYTRKRMPRKTTKMGYRKAKGIVARRTKARARKGMDTKFVKCVERLTISPKQDGSNANHTFNNFQLLDETGTGVLSVLKTQLYQQNVPLYDKVRINSIKVTCIPKANVLDQYVGQLDAAANMTGPGQIYSAIDRDGPLIWGGAGDNTVKLWSGYKTYRQQSVLKKLTRKYQITYPQGVWLDTANVYADAEMNRRLGLYGAIGVFTFNNVEDNFEIFNEPLYEAYIEYNVVFQGEKPTQVTVDPLTGVITITPIEYDYDTMYPEETWEKPIQPEPPAV